MEHACNLKPTEPTSCITNVSFVDLAGETLPRLVPQMLVGARELAIPLLAACAVLSPSSSQRDALLAQLFNLKKRPSAEERRVIVHGVVRVAAWADRAVAEGELLAQCWEQLAHRAAERRLLVAETCAALVSHVSAAMRGSLLMSMLQQLLADREPVVREAAVVALAVLVARCDDGDRYGQCEQLTLTAAVDGSSQVSCMCRTTLLPVLAQWATQIGRVTIFFHPRTGTTFCLIECNFII